MRRDAELAHAWNVPELAPLDSQVEQLAQDCKLVIHRLGGQLLTKLLRLVRLDLLLPDLVESKLAEHGLEVILQCQSLGVNRTRFVVVLAIGEEPLLELRKSRNLVDLLSKGTVLQRVAQLAFMLLGASLRLDRRRLPDGLNRAVGVPILHVHYPGCPHCPLLVRPLPQSYAHR